MDMDGTVRTKTEIPLLGFSMDSGAAVSTIGVQQLEEYCRKYQVSSSIKDEKELYEFGYTIHSSCEVFVVHIPC